MAAVSQQIKLAFCGSLQRTDARRSGTALPGKREEHGDVWRAHAWSSGQQFSFLRFVSIFIWQIAVCCPYFYGYLYAIFPRSFLTEKVSDSINHTIVTHKLILKYKLRLYRYTALVKRDSMYSPYRNKKLYRIWIWWKVTCYHELRPYRRPSHYSACHFDGQHSPDDRSALPPLIFETHCHLLC